jgi:hypothetical protein
MDLHEVEGPRFDPDEDCVWAERAWDFAAERVDQEYRCADARERETLIVAGSDAVEDGVVFEADGDYGYYKLTKSAEADLNEALARSWRQELRHPHPVAQLAVVRPLVQRARNACGGRRRPGARRRSKATSRGDPDDPEPAERRRVVHYTFACLTAEQRGAR